MDVRTEVKDPLPWRPVIKDVRASRRAPLSKRELEFAQALSRTPGKMPPVHPVRAYLIVKRARALFMRRKELARAKAPRFAKARAAAKVARLARRVGR